MQMIKKIKTETRYKPVLPHESIVGKMARVHVEFARSEDVEIVDQNRGYIWCRRKDGSIIKRWTRSHLVGLLPLPEPKIDVEAIKNAGTREG